MPLIPRAIQGMIEDLRFTAGGLGQEELSEEKT
jgi:hypothetical protein